MTEQLRRARRRRTPAGADVTYVPAPRACWQPGCPNQGTVLDGIETEQRRKKNKGTLGDHTVVYLCETHFKRLYPQLQPKPIDPGLPIFGGHYPGGLRSKPMPDDQIRRRWSKESG